MQVVVASGARVDAAQVTWLSRALLAGAVMLSVTARPLSVTLPLLRTAKVYVTGPVAVTVVGSAVLTRLSAPARAAVTEAAEVFEVTRDPPGAEAAATAVFWMRPLSTSAWVVV